MNWILFGIIFGGAIVISAISARNTKELPDVSERMYRILFFTLLCIFSFLLFYKVGEIPIPYHVDEAGMVYDASSLASYGTDRWGYHYPVYLINYGGGQSALYMYLAAASIKLFGYSVTAVRLPAIFFSLLSTAVFAVLVRKAYGNTDSLIALGVFCFLPFSVMHSRWGLDAYLLFPMLILSCTALYSAVKTDRNRLFILSGCLFGVTLYSYAVSYILVPVFLGSVLIFLLLNRRIRAGQLAGLILPILLLALPLILLLAVNNGLIGEIRTPYFSVPKLFAYRGSEFSIGNILQNLRFGERNIFYNIFVWDSLRYNVIPRFGSLFYFTIPLIILGLVLCVGKSIRNIRSGEFSPDLMICFLFLISFGIQLLLPYSNVNRACAVYFPLIWFLAAGLNFVFTKSRAAAILSCGIWLFLTVSFTGYYFREFPRELAYELSITSVEDLAQALDFAEEININNEPVTVYGLSQPYLYTLLVKNIDPETFRNSVEMKDQNVMSFGSYKFDPGEVSADRVYLLRTYGWVPFELREDAFTTADFGTVTVYYSEAKPVPDR